MHCLILLLATVGTDPHPGYPEAYKKQLDVLVNGQTIKVWGWRMSDGSVHYFQGEQGDVIGAPGVSYNGGLDINKIFATGRREGVLAEGHKAKAYAAQIQAGEPSQLHVTVIGTDEARGQVVTDIKRNPAFAGIRDRLLVQDYSPATRPSRCSTPARMAARKSGGPRTTRSGPMAWPQRSTPS